MYVSVQNKKIITNILNEIYKAYRDKGILAIYLWGSVTTDGYNPKKSDIDCVAIVTDTTDESDVAVIREFMKKRAPSLHEFKINYLYYSELQTGISRSKIGRWMDPRILLLDFSEWEFVVGRKFKRTEFPRPISWNTAIAIQVTSLERIHLPNILVGEYKHRQYFCKYLMKICHYLNQQANGRHAFSYRNLTKQSPPASKKIAQKLLTIRKQSWNLQLFKKELPQLLAFLRQV